MLKKKNDFTVIRFAATNSDQSFKVIFFSATYFIELSRQDKTARSVTSFYHKIPVHTSLSETAFCKHHSKQYLLCKE